jgi:hypothetical protein
VAAIAVLVPEREWDMAAYVALAIEDGYENPEALHKATWDIVRQNTTDKEFTLLTAAGAYRQAQFAEPENFVSQLPMYRLKVGYIALLKALAPAMGPALAIQAINAASVLLIGGCLLFAMWRGGCLQGALLLAPLMLVSGLMLMARLATPDMLVAALTVAGTMLLCSRVGWAGVPVLVAAFLVRPDTIIFLFALVLSALAFRWRRGPALAAFGLSAALTVSLSSMTGNIGWWPHFWFSTVEMQANMSGFHPDFSLLAYAKGVARGLAIALIDHRWLAVAAMLLAGTWFLFRDGREFPKQWAMPMLAAFLAVGGKFVVFPLPDDRIYSVFLWIFALGVFAVWRPQFLPAGRPPTTE